MKKINDISSKIFFTSDQHFGHDGIIKFANRPHNDVEKMDEDIINRWNNTVPSDGLTFVLGDIGFCSKNQIIHALGEQPKGMVTHLHRGFAF